MTCVGKMFSSRAVRRRLPQPRWLPIVFAFLLTSTGCTSTPSASAGRSPEQKDEIKNLVQAGKIFECRLSSADWTILGDVSQAQMFKSEGKWALIYEALLRSGPRSVFQPLQANFSFNGDGIAMGQRGAPRVTDVKTFEDTNRNRWFVSRSQMANSELFSGLVEVLANGKNFRSVIPVPAGESVQQIWPSLPAVSGVANIVVRSTPSDDSGTGNDDESIFRWYQVGLADNSAKLITLYKPRQENIQPAGFISMERTTEPVAVTIVQPRLDTADADPRAGDQTTKISLRRIFTRAPAERIVFAAKGSFSSLTLSDSSVAPSTHLSWILTPLRGGNRYLQTVTLPVRFIPERYFSRPTARDFESFLATEINYDANTPDFSFNLSKDNQPIPVLAWWGKLENDVALLVQVLSPAFRSLRGNVLKSVDGTALGVQFQPSLAIIPPKPYNRVMYFSAAPTQSEKSIMILSNRSDSADISKESNLYLCLF